MRTCGRIATYQDGCHCDDCRQAGADARAAARRRAQPTRTSRNVPPVDWSAAACAGLNPDLFHPVRGQNAAPAKAVCAGCDLRAACLAWALANREEHGIWGGLSVRDRQRIAATR